MKDEVKSTTSIQYVKPEIVDLGAASTIRGGELCTPGSVAGGTCNNNGITAGICTAMGFNRAG